MPDRERRDKETRDRVDELAASWAQAVQRFARWQRKATAFQSAGMVITLVFVAVGFLIIQGERWDGIRRSCEQTNAQTEATINTLMDLGADARSVDIARVRYPHVPPLAHRDGAVLRRGPRPDYSGPSSCEEAASERVSAWRL